jgi:ankyrin repeat protein
VDHHDLNKGNDMRRDSWNWIGLCVSTALAAVIATGATAQNPPKPQRLPPGTPSTSPTPAPAPTVVPGAAPDGVSDGFVKQNIKDVIGSSKPQDLNGEPLQNFDPNEPPSIHFEPPIADMGEMIADVPKTITIKIKNVTDKPIRISKAIPGCGCTTPNWPKDPIAPGATGDCEITLRPGPKQGIKLSKKVTFQIEGHAPVVLSVEGDVVAYVTMTPDIIESPTDAAAAGVKPTEIVLESTEGIAFKITEIVPPVIKNPPMDAATKHVLVVDWPMWEEAGRQPKIMIKTDNPKAVSMTMLVKRAISANSPPMPPVTPPGPGTTDLVNAVRAGDLAKVSALIAAGADVNERDRAGSRTALHWAAKGANRPAMEVLVAAKADPNIKDRQGRTPLWGAVETDLETVKFLVEKGANVNARDQIQSTPLLWCAGFGKPETVAFLLSKGADVKATDDNGWTPLIWAAGLGQPQTVAILVKSGADLKAADKQTGDTPLLRGARTGKPESLKMLLDEGADVKAKNKAGQTALHLAAASGSAEKVQLLLAAHADPAAVDEKGWTALDHAMNRTTGDKAKLLEVLKPVSPAPKVNTAPAAAK